MAIACWHMLVHGITTPAAVMLIAAFVLARTILAVAERCTRIAGALAGSSLPMRSMAQRMDCRAAVVRRQFDPDAAGRARPRAPAAVLAAD